jgi:BirA family transcriptional regulator, biotin operon repressor / biotin---[acetyl-CoA-carboxylase] ligase
MNTKRRPQDLSGLSLVVALSIVNALQMPELQIKWPNDIYAEHQKLAGILIDLGQKPRVGSSIIISIGINVNQIDELAVDNKWSSLQKIRGESLNRTDVLIRILNQLTSDLEKFELNGFLAFQKSWEKFDYLYQREIMIMQVDRIIYGQALGVDDIGRLILKNEEGQILHLNFGQASIKPQY